MRTEHPRLPADRRAELERIMAGLADDRAMEVALHHHFGAELRRTLVALCREHGLADPAPDDLDGLAFDACTELGRIACSWRPDGGALPWVYGRERLLAMLRRHAGPPTRSLPDAALLEGATAPAVAPDDPPAVVVLDALVRDGRHPVLVRLAEAMAGTVSERDVELVLLYLQQQASADPSPSHTVALLVGRRPDAVRQAFHRARRRLRGLAVADPRYRPLLALPFLADGERAA
jgi:DNA-directed RNA polymerase specialized sigma24 family protein